LNFIIENTRTNIGTAHVETVTVGKNASHPLRLLVLSLSIMLFMLLFIPYESILVFSGPPVSGDWIVTGTESYYDEVIVLNGNLLVRSSGNLTFRKVTLKMNCAHNGQYNITVESGGRFDVLEGSVITSANLDKRIGFFDVHQGSTLRMSNSEFLGSDQLSLMSGDIIVENSLISNSRWGVSIQDDGVIVRNNNITRNDEEGVSVHFCSPTIYNNSITSNFGSGISIYWPESSPLIQENTIAMNEHFGIGCEGSSPIIQDNDIVRNGGGITCHNSSSTISGNLIAENLGEGIVCSYYSNSSIVNNTITSNIGPGPGISCHDHSHVIIQGNTIKNTTQGDGIGLNLHCTGIIQGNMISNNSMQGIGNGLHSNPLIQGNIITSNWDAGIHCADNSLPEVHWNDIYGNGVGVGNDDSSVTVNATHNYWGDGPSIGGEVHATPWLTESIFHAGITSPLSGETVSSTVPVSTEVDARSGVHKVEFYIDDELEYTDCDASYEWNWDTTQYAEAEHEIEVKAYDMLGLKTSSSIAVFVDNTAPAVSIKEPAPESTYSGTVRVSVNATDNRELANVHVRVNNAEWLVMTYNSTALLWKYDLNSTAFSDGQHILMVLALDDASNPTTTSTTLFIDNTPPTLTIQTPQSGTTVGMTLSVEIQASDASGISRIEIYLQDVLVYTDHDVPYEWLWDTTQYPNGGYTITVRAYDTLGKVQTSETTVTVRNVESPWWQTNFWTIIEVLVAIGGLMLGIIAYLTRKREEKKSK